MCEQTEVNYLDGDVVWVKLGPSWWPGEVQDLSKVAPEIVKSFRKAPIAVVKFFQEDKYEYVKNIDHIYKYNCRRKHEFIKKGLDMHRAKRAFMDKFPGDVCHAEMLTNGDPDIITNDEFAPEKKPNYSEIFGTPTSKPKGSGVRGRRSLGTPKSAGARLVSTPRITHPRFLGKSDYEVRILEQSTPQAPTSHYTCHICGFESSRLNVIVLHNRSHSNGTYVPTKQKSKKNTSSPKKNKGPKSFATTNSIDEDLELIRQGFTITTEETTTSESEIENEIEKEREEKKEKKKTSAKPNKRKGNNNKTAVMSASKKAKVSSSICNNLLADWGDDDSSEEQEKPPEEPPKPIEKTPETPKTTEDTTKTDEDKKDDTLTTTTPEKQSCFDFEDEESKEEEVLEKSPGRKIPRVIPPKRTSKDEEEPEKDATSEDPEKSKEENDKSSKRDLEAFEKFLEATEVPDFSSLTDLSPGKKKPDKKLDDSSSDKTNGVLKKDTPESSTDTTTTTTTTTTPTPTTTKETESTTITQIPKKRFVRNFEEFETFMNDSRTPSSESEEIETQTKTTLEVSKLKSQLMSKLNDSPPKPPVDSVEDDEEASSKDSPKDKFFLRRKKSTETLKPDRRKKKLLKDFNKATAAKAAPTSSKLEDKPEADEVSEIIKETVLEDENKTDMQEAKRVEEEITDGPKNLIENPETQVSDVPELEATEKMEEEPVVAEAEPEKETEPVEEEKNIEKTSPIVEETPPEEVEETPPEKLEETFPEKVEETPPEIMEETLPDKVEMEQTPPEIMEETLSDKVEMEETPPVEMEETPPVEMEETPPVEMEETSPVEMEETPLQNVEEPQNEDTSMIEEIPCVNVEEPPIVEEAPIIEEAPIPAEETPFLEESTIVEEEPPIPEETETLPIIEEPPVIEEPSQKEIEDSRSQKMLADISDICIDNSDNLSGLSTLAAVSELSGNLYDKLETVVPQITETAETTETTKEETILEESTNPPPSMSTIEDTESSMIPVQDEPFPPKPVQTLANFSMDFSDSNSESTIIKTIVNEEKEKEKVETPETNVIEEKQKETEIPSDFESIEKEINKFASIETTSDALNSFPENISQPEMETNFTEYSITTDPAPLTEPIKETNPEATLESEIAKLTDTQPGAEGVVHEQHQNTSSSKLLEILTDAPHKRAEKSNTTTTRSLISGQSKNIQMVISGDSKSVSKKFDPKTSKFIIKSSKIPGMSSQQQQQQTKSNKPIILSEKIIKPMTDIDNVSVKKVTSKRTYQDVEDIDTFIIQKPTKKSNSGEMDQQDIILAPKTDTLQKYRNTFNRPRGKPKIIEQTIIKAADPVQPTPVNNETQESPFDDNMFDINSMPIVLSDQILTPESIENMPVVMQNLIPTSSSTNIVEKQQQQQQQPQTIITKRGGAMQKQQIKLVNKEKVNLSSTSHESLPKVSQNVMVKNIIPRGLSKNQKVYQTGSKILKNNPAVITQPGKPGKFIILPSSTASTPTGSKYTVGKRTAVKTVQQTVANSPTTSKQLKTLQQNIPNEPTGNKIMIVTNQHGVQSRVLLTPAQQKLLGCKMPTTKITKSPSKGGIVQKSILTSKGTLIAPSNSGIKTTAALASQTIVTSKGQVYTTTTSQPLVTSEGQVLTPLSQQQLKTMKSEQQKFANKKIQMHTQRVLLSEKPNDPHAKNKMNMMPTKTKTILIKGSQGQTIKKIQTQTGETKNVLLQGGQKTQLMSMGSKQILVNSKGQIIKTSDGKMAIPKQAQEKIQKMSPKTPRIVSKSGRQQVILQKQQMVSPALPPLAPITAAQRKEMPATPTKLEQRTIMQKKEKIIEPQVLPPPVADTPGEQKQPNQLVIQDALGNQTTVTEGQILALPSGETVDGQPQSYVLVTVDESGNLVPISNDTLMSLDPNLGAGGDMNNIVLQIDQGAQDKPAELPIESQQIVADQQLLSVDNQQLMITEEQVMPVSTAESLITTDQVMEQHPEATTFINPEEQNQGLPLLQEQQTAVAINNGDSSQQLIITGDPESTQKFLASLTDGNTDLSSLLSGTDGNIIINTDGQQILLNTDTENQILLSVNSDNLGLIQTSEPDTSQFVTQQSIKNLDILAAALADTDVFQQKTAEKSQALTKVSSSAQSQLSPNSAMYPMNVGSVLEPTLTLGSPIMTPLEVPSVNNKKINSDVDSALITQVPSSLELPITITDPSISQTVSQQVMLGNELQANLELPISISDSGITSSANFVYSLPSLDDSTELEQQQQQQQEQEQKQFTESAAVMTTENIYNTALTGSMSMPLLTEEPETPVIEQEQIAVSCAAQDVTPIIPEQEQQQEEEESTPTTSASTTSTSLPEEIANSMPEEKQEEETTTITNTPLITEETNMTEEQQTKVEEKLSNELHIGPIEEDLDLNNADICSSLSEPPPGMFDKSFLLDKNEDGGSTNDEPMNSLPILSDDSPQIESVNNTPVENSQNSEIENDNDNENENERIALSETPNSDLNSPRLDIDENSQEIPIQPPIVTTLSAATTFDENNSHSDGDLQDENKKRVMDDEDDDDNDDNDKKRSKLSCD